MENEIVNKVQQSGLINLDIEDYYPQGERVIYDLKNNLFQGIALKEKEFRDFLEKNNWLEYKGKYVAITCSSDAIIPSWAYMLLMTKIAESAKYAICGTLEELNLLLIKGELEKLDFSSFKEKKIIIKGCSKIDIPSYAYGEITRLLAPYVKSLMFGEPCSTVPVLKKL